MIETLINECMGIGLSSKIQTMKEGTVIDLPVSTENNTTATTTKVKKKSSLKATREPKITQKYKQSINPSKRHRDRLNGELDNLAKLLPFSEDVIARLDKLSILRLSVSFLRNKNFFKAALKEKREKDETINNIESQFSSFLSKALDGFLLVITMEGEIFFASESVKDYLGYSQSSVLHQLLETFVHDDDKDELSGFLRGSSDEKIVELEENAGEPVRNDEVLVGEQREFILRLKSVLNNGTSDMYKPFKLSGRIQRLNLQPETEKLKYALFAFCTPARTSISVLEIRMKTTLFCSKNRIDLSFLDMDARGKEYFGYSKKDIFGRSSYVLVHRQDLQHVRCKHTELMTCGKTSIGTFRLMNKNSEWNWISGYARVMYKNGKPDFMVTTNRILTDTEGKAMLKIRDHADYKALENIGLVEPDDPAKALELGFPSRSAAKYDFMAENDPVPMPLADFAGLTENVINETNMLCSKPIFDENRSDVLSKTLNVISEIPSQQQRDQQATPMQQDPYSPVTSMVSNHSDHSDHSNHSNHRNHNVSLHSPQENAAAGFSNVQIKLEPGEVPSQRMGCQMSPSSHQSVDLQSMGSSSSSKSSINVQIKQQKQQQQQQPKQQQQQQQQGLPDKHIIPAAASAPGHPRLPHPSPSLIQRFPTNIFDDLHIDFDPSNTNIIPQQPLPSQPRFSFLPPSFADDSNRPLKYSTITLDSTSQSRSSMPISAPDSSGYHSSLPPYEQIGPNVTLCGPEYDMGSLYNGHLNGYSQLPPPPPHNQRIPTTSFLPHLLDTYLPAHHQNTSNWVRPSDYMPPALSPNPMFNVLNNNSPSIDTSVSNSQYAGSPYYF